MPARNDGRTDVVTVGLKGVIAPVVRHGFERVAPTPEREPANLPKRAALSEQHDPVASHEPLPLREAVKRPRAEGNHRVR